MSTGDYIPKGDAQALLFFQTMQQEIALDPPQFGLLPADADALNDVLQPFAAAMGTAPGIKSPVITSERRDTRETCEALFRQYAMIIRNDAGVSDQAKILIGIRPINPNRTEIPCPTTSPEIGIVSATPGVHTIRFSDPENGGSKAKPRGARSFELYVGIADKDVLITDPTLCQYYGAFTKNPIGVQFAASENGMQATYYGRWAGANGDTGPWSVPATLVIAA